MQDKRIVITGMGAVTPIGTGLDSFWNGVTNGRNGVDKITLFNTDGFPVKFAAEVKDFDPEEWFEAKAAKRMDRVNQFGFVGAMMAYADSGLDKESIDKNRVGVIIGSGIGGIKSFEEAGTTILDKGVKSISPLSVSKTLANMTACFVSIEFGFKGPLSAPSVACSTGSVAVGDAFRVLQYGDADIMFAGSAEACITPVSFGGFCATRSMSTINDYDASRPFDKDRDGFIMGEGAGVVVLEELEHAKKRKARIYAEIAGYGNTSDAFHLVAPHPEGDGMMRVMQNALADAKLKPQDIDYINAHGTSTVLNDKTESKAIIRAFGDHAHSLKVSSIKSMIGHLMGASGSVEFISTVLSVYNDIITPTINYKNPDPDCPLDYVVDGKVHATVNAAISNSFGFGGGNACLAVKKYRE